MIALVVVAVAALCSQQALCAPPMQQDSKTDVEVCMVETGTTYEEIMAWADGGDASENLKCQIKCMMMLSKTMTDDGRFSLEAMLEVMPQETQAAYTECIEIEQGSELCETAYRHHKCIRDKMPEFYGEWVRKLTASTK